MKSSVRLLAGLLASTSFVTVAHAGDISGNVHDATGTRSLQAATVRIVELDRSVRTDRSGNYIFGEVPAGTYTLEVSYVGAEIERKQVTVTQAGRVAGNFDLAAIGGGDILVIGQAANLSSSLSRQKAADGVVSVLTRDAIGQFPDQNVAESLRRLPGVNILNDQGEGRFVSVRGLDPNLVSSSLNGVRLPAPESDVREVALDVISSDTIESIEVRKSNTPDMDADGIGGSVEIKTTSAFDRKKDYYALRAEGSWNDYSGKVMPKGSLDFSKRIGDDIGVAGSVSYYKRKFETDNVETGDDWATDADGNPYMPSVEYRDYDVERTRINAALSFDWRASDTTKIYLRGNWSQFDDHEYRRRTTIELDEPSSYDGTVGSFDSEDGTIAVKRDLKDRFERQRIRTAVLGGDTDTGTWKFNWSASYAKSTELEDFSVDPMRFTKKFKKGSGVAVDFDYSGMYYPLYDVTSGADAFYDPSSYPFDKLELTTLSDSQDEEWAAKADLARTFAGDDGDFTIQAGAKGRWRKKTYNLNETDYDGYDGDLTLADMLGSQTYRITGIEPVSSKTGPAAFYLGNTANFEVNDYDTAFNSASSDYGISEDILAGYALARWDSDSLRVIGGLRVEHTRNRMNGNDVDGTGDVPVVTPVTYRKSYTNWLPSITMRYSPQQDLVARFAVYRNLMRPNLSDMAPRFSINDDNEAEFGNPALKPYQAWNADFGMEYYFGSNGALSFGAFYKSIEDYIVTVTHKDYDYAGNTYDKFAMAINGDSAEVAGFEASYSQVYSMLPSPFDGLLTQLNYTYTYTRASVIDEDGVKRHISMPNASRNTFNVVLGYEKGPVELRAAGTYRSSLLEEIGDQPDEDRYANEHFQLDLSAKYKLTDNIRLFADWINVNNAKYFAYENFSGAKRLQQFEEYGSTVKFGARVTF